MPYTTSSRRQPIAVALVLLLLVTMIGVSISTASDIALGTAAPASETLTVDERTYYEYVAPRLDRLVSEVDDVVTMVDGRSRDIIALSVSGDRIEALIDEIVDFEATHGVPERFADVHMLIIDGSDTVAYTFGEARTALRTFNFSHMSSLVQQFGIAAQTLHNAQDQMLAVAGVAPARHPNSL